MFLYLQAVPWHLYRDETTRFWVHYGLVILGFVLAVVTIIAQWAKPAPYGKHEANVKKILFYKLSVISVAIFFF